ncbi:MAG: hypothetical protein FWD11_08220, partial [Micrococcales bacterium]|nr:hypothetical protein [Micrococcales bacterium]
MPLSPDQSRLVATERWQWLPEVLERWYAEPLTAADGASREEIDAATVVRRRPHARPTWRDLVMPFWRTTEPDEVLPGPLPELLVEWFLLVGKRVRTIQDNPATLDALHGNDDGIEVWWENQGCWTLRVGPDGTCFVDDESYSFPAVPLPTAVHAMVLSDTLVGVWCGTDVPSTELAIGPLGRIAADVRGGYVDRWVEPDPVPCQSLSAAYSELPVLGNPHWGVPPRGDAETVLRGLEDG